MSTHPGIAAIRMEAGRERGVREHAVILLAVGAMVLVGAVYWQSFSRMIGMWSLMNYEHCWLVVPISLYVLWRKRSALSGLDLEGSTPGVLFVLLLVLSWTVARAADVQAVEFAAATLLIFAVFWAIAGNEPARKSAFPLLLLLAAVPVGEILVHPLMNVTADVASALLYLSGVPVLREATFLTLPGGSFEVADVCSGLRYLLAGGMASLAYAYVTWHGSAKRAIFVATAAVVLVLANGVRAFIVMYVASATEMRVFGGKDHVYFGMVLFLVVFLALVYVGERYADERVVTVPRPAPRRRTGGLPLGIVAAVLLVVIAGPALQYVRAQQPVADVAGRSLPELPGCSGPAAWTRDWVPSFQQADYVLQGAYTCAGAEAGVYTAGYLRQHQGKELINSGNSVWPDAWRRYVRHASTDAGVANGTMRVREVLVRSPERSELIWYWYEVGEHHALGPFDVKLRGALHALAFDEQEARVIVVTASGDAGSDPAALRPSLERVAGALWARRPGTEE